MKNYNIESQVSRILNRYKKISSKDLSRKLLANNKNFSAIKNFDDFLIDLLKNNNVFSIIEINKDEYEISLAKENDKDKDEDLNKNTKIITDNIEVNNDLFKSHFFNFLKSLFVGGILTFFITFVYMYWLLKPNVAENTDFFKYFYVLIISFYYIYLSFINKKENPILFILVHLLSIFAIYNVLLAINFSNLPEVKGIDVAKLFLAFIISSFNYKNLGKSLYILIHILNGPEYIKKISVIKIKKPINSFLYFFIEILNFVIVFFIVLIVLTIVFFVIHDSYILLISLGLNFKQENFLNFMQIAITFITVLSLIGLFLKMLPDMILEKINFYLKKVAEIFETKVNFYMDFLLKKIKIENISHFEVYNQSKVNYINLLILVLTKIVPAFTLCIFIGSKMYHEYYIEKNNGFCTNLNNNDLIIKKRNLEKKYNTYLKTGIATFTEYECEIPPEKISDDLLERLSK